MDLDQSMETETSHYLKFGMFVVKQYVSTCNLGLDEGLAKNNPANIYLFEVNNGNARKRWEICSKLTIRIPERRQWRRSGVFIINFEHIYSVTIFDFEQVNVSWERS